jgi:hypothetical protein
MTLVIKGSKQHDTDSLAMVQPGKEIKREQTMYRKGQAHGTALLFGNLLS